MVENVVIIWTQIQFTSTTRSAVLIKNIFIPFFNLRIPQACVFRGVDVIKTTFICI